MQAINEREQQAPAAAAAVPAAPTRYLITLLTGATPIRTRLPKLPPIVGARVFCEHYRVDGSPHVRIQLGHFESLRIAAEVLRVVRPYYPQATVRGVRLVPRPNAPLGDRPRDARPPAPQGQPPDTWDSSGGGSAQRFAVELLWSPAPIDLTHVPPLTLFDDHTLYAVMARRGGHDWHGLRLGFFPDRGLAKAAAEEAASYFTGALAVPVADSEFAQARQAEIQPFVARVGLTSFVPPAGLGG